jgi:hypothetical protein
MRLLLALDLRARGVPYSSWQLRRLEARGLFPRRVQLAPGTNSRVAWIEEEVTEWIQSRPRVPLPEPAPESEAPARISPRTGKPVRAYRRRAEG